MKMKLLASAALVMLAVAGSASAAEILDQTEVVFTVDPTCAFSVLDSSLQGSAGAFDDGSGFISVAGGMNSSGVMNAVCSTGVSYTIATNAAVGGDIALTGDNTAGIVPAFIYQGEQFSGVPFGSVANGEHYSGVANGEVQAITYNVAVNSLDGGSTTLAIPVADTYRSTVQWTFSDAPAGP
ncbi:hypothetical protein [Novilysobacter arseniciresistens]|uniref:hypothetical protein n=1 Tax=Novilysobacter arseniciresistens TaxID=1385522 RepID=UPI001269FFC1|nr:hypothetical protein [Lysobacter arseniciresistens]